MSWVKIESRFPGHPKVVSVSIEAAWLHLCGMCYAAEYLTNGFIPGKAVRRLDPRVKRHKLCVDELVDAGLWEIAEGGYQIHDYLLYNPSAEEVRHLEDAKVKAGQLGGRASVAARRLKYGTAKPTEAGASRHAEPGDSEAAGSSAEARIRIRSGPGREEQDGAPAPLCQEEEDDAAVVADPLAAGGREPESTRAACEKKAAAPDARPSRNGVGHSAVGNRRRGRRADPAVAALLERFVALGEQHNITVTTGKFGEEDVARLVGQTCPELVERAMVAWFESPLVIQREREDYRLKTFVEHFDRVVKANGLRCSESCAMHASAREDPEVQWS